MMGAAHWHEMLPEACIDPSAEKVYNYIFGFYCYVVSLFSSYLFFCSVKRDKPATPAPGEKTFLRFNRRIIRKKLQCHTKHYFLCFGYCFSLFDD